MKVRLHIQFFSTAFIVIMGMFHNQPLLIRYEFEKNVVSTKAGEQSCIPAKKNVPVTKKCTIPKKSDEPEDCNNNGCNPCVTCPIVFSCYLVENMFSYSFSEISAKQNLFHFNDNRTQGSLSECWHPPEITS